MEYSSLELSANSSIPVALYEFSIGTTTWRYASSETDVTVPDLVDTNGNSILFLATSIKDDGVSQSGEPISDDVLITIPQTLPLANIVSGVFPSDTIYVVMRRFNRGADSAPITWIGSVKSAKQVSRIERQLQCLMMIASFKRPGLRLGWQRSCPYALYDSNCKVNPAAYRVDITIDAINGTTILSSGIQALQAGKYIGGYVEWASDYGSFERRAIEGQTPDVFYLLEGTRFLQVGMTIACYPGCPRTTEGCKGFNNLPNYGGFPHMPGRSPFDGSQVF